MQTDEQRYRMLVEQVSDWIWEVDENGVYTYASPRIYDILGYLPSEVVGKTPFDLMEPAEAKKIAAVFAYHVSNKLPFNSLENINLHRDGHEVILETSGSPIIDENRKCVGYRGIDRDITERKMIERKQRQLLEIIDACPDFIATFDLANNGTYYNPAARKMLGIQEPDAASEEVKDRWLTTKIKEEGIPFAIKNGHWKGETFIVKEDGTNIPVSQIIVSHQSENGEVEFLSTIAHDITEQKELEKLIYDQAHFDSLTNLPNRRLLQKRWERLSVRGKESRKAAVFFMDLDNFKSINDTLGHEVGDQLLRMVASRLQAAIEGNDFVCRYGGDEFIMIFEDIQEAAMEAKAEMMIASLQNPFEIEQHSLHVTGSLGISLFPDDGRDLETIVQKADNAMYEIKRNGKNNYQRVKKQ